MIKLIFSKLKKDFHQLQEFLETEEALGEKCYQIRDIKSLDDVSPAIIEHVEQCGLLDKGIIEWILTKPKSNKFKAYIPELLEQIPADNLAYHYLTIAYLAATGTEYPTIDDWKWDECPNKQLTLKYLTLAISNFVVQYQEENDCNLENKIREALSIRSRLEKETNYTLIELNATWSEVVFFDVIKQSLPMGFEALDKWAMSGHTKALQLMYDSMATIEGGIGSLDKWVLINSSIPSYPLKIGEMTLNNNKQLQDWVRNIDSSELLALHSKLPTIDWLTITSNLSDRMANDLAVDCWHKYHCIKEPF